MKKNPKNFESALQELEEIVNRLEDAALPLDEALALFKNGLQLSNYCREKLTKSEKEMQVLLKDSAGNFQLNDFKSSD